MDERITDFRIEQRPDGTCVVTVDGEEHEFPSDLAAAAFVVSVLAERASSS